MVPCPWQGCVCPAEEAAGEERGGAARLLRAASAGHAPSHRCHQGPSCRGQEAAGGEQLRFWDRSCTQREGGGGGPWDGGSPDGTGSTQLRATAAHGLVLSPSPLQGDQCVGFQVLHVSVCPSLLVWHAPTPCSHPRAQQHPVLCHPHPPLTRCLSPCRAKTARSRKLAQTVRGCVLPTPTPTQLGTHRAPAVGPTTSPPCWVHGTDPSALTLASVACACRGHRGQLCGLSPLPEGPHTLRVDRWVTSGCWGGGGGLSGSGGHTSPQGRGLCPLC